MPAIPEQLAAAISLHQAGRLHEAEQIYRQVLKAEPNQVDALHLLGVLASQVGNHELAVELITRAVDQHRTEPTFHGNLGDALKAQGKLDKAISSYRRALELKPDFAEVHSNLGNALLELGKLEESVACFRRALELKPDLVVAHYNLGNALKYQTKLDEAVASYRRALELEPNLHEAYNNLGDTYQAQGKLDEAVACFRHAVDLKPDDAATQNNLGTGFQALGRLDEAVASYRRALELDPDHAEVHSNLGDAYQDQGKLDDAIASYRRALELKPDFPESYNNLGTAFHHLGKPNEAFAYFRRATELQPDNAMAHNNLGHALQSEGKYDEAIASYRRALALKPDFAVAHTNLGNTFQAQGQMDNALDSYSRALELDAGYADAHFGRSMLRLLEGDFQRGWPEYEWRWKINQLPDPEFSQPRWNGEPLEDRTILLHAEQGFGDTVQFVRYAALVKQHSASATIVVACRRPVARLLVTSPAIDQVIVDGDDFPQFDVHLPLLSLPGVFRTTVETIPANVPYLFADSKLIAHWRERLDSVSGMGVGINWQGRSGIGEFRKRDIPLKFFAALAQIPGVSLVSLQMGEGREDLVRNSGPQPILDLGPDFDTAHGAFMDTAAVMMNLDLVITSDTSIPHLAGALGIPVWLALPYVQDWRWLLDRSDSPWYPTMRLFRQKSLGDWPGVFQEIQTALQQRLSSR